MIISGGPELAGAYAGERLFLIGNGPSLAETPLDALESEFSMAMNKIDLIYDKVGWRPDFYICFSDNPILQGPLRKSIDAHIHMDDVVVFLNEPQQNHVQSAKGTNFFNFDNLFKRDQTPANLSMADIQDVDIKWLEQFWSYDPPEIVYGFHTMYAAVQLAMWMGFEEIYLVGADLGTSINIYMLMNNNIDPADYGGDAISYLIRAWEAGKLPSAIVNGFALKLLIWSEFFMRFTAYSKQYFDNSYSDIKYSAKKDIEQRKAHLVIKRICETNGLDVYNATLGGELEVYQRVNLNDIL